MSIETLEDEATDVFNFSSFPHRSDVPVNIHSLGEESVHEVNPSGLGFLVGNREQSQGDGALLHVDVVSISSSTLSGSFADTSGREARRNSRQLFWDAFSRRSTWRHFESPTIVFSAYNSDEILSHDRWLLDFSDDIFNDGIGSDFGFLGSRRRRSQSRSEFWARLHEGLDDRGRRTSYCASGLHPAGACSCEPFSTTQESSTRESISRIAMLAEALFEVLDEIHWQPVSLPLSMMSLPAPESVVDSFPLKIHKKANKVEGSEDIEQCFLFHPRV